MYLFYSSNSLLFPIKPKILSSAYYILSSNWLYYYSIYLFISYYYFY
jgi:hypothetical protein